jgi:hypothetical protein
MVILIQHLHLDSSLGAIMSDNDQPPGASEAGISLSTLRSLAMLNLNREPSVFEWATFSMAHSSAWVANGNSAPTLNQVIDEIAKQSPVSTYARSMHRSLLALVQAKPTDFDPWLLGYTLDGVPVHFDPWVRPRPNSGKTASLGPLISKLRAQIADEEERKKLAPEILEDIARAIANYGRAGQITPFHRHLPTGKPLAARGSFGQIPKPMRTKLTELLIERPTHEGTPRGVTISYYKKD